MQEVKPQTFKRGIHPPSNKRSEDAPFEELPTPKTVAVSLSQHIGAPAKPTVAVGDEVKIGDVIGEEGGFVSARVHAPICGTVKEIVKKGTATGKAEHVVIEGNGKTERTLLPDYDGNFLGRVRDAGIVGMGGAGFPASVKFAPKTEVDSLIVNAAECEPYITCDYRMILERAENVVRGAREIANQLKSELYIGVEDNKRAAIDALLSLTNKYDYKVVPLKTKYPQGAEKQLINAVLKREVPLGKLPSDVGAVVANACTAYAVSRAVFYNEPLTIRPMTITGGGISAPRNLLVPIGTPYSDVIAFAGGLKGDVVKLISGGPMMGHAVFDESVTVTKTSNCILALTADEAKEENYSSCINCGKCASACPMRLMPMYIDSYTRCANYKEAARYGANYCMECGCCSYVCPAKRPIVQSVRLAKRKIKELKL